MKITADDRILILAPHPDDELLSSFMLMRSACRCGARVKVLFLTNGERNHLAHMRSRKKIFITASSKRKYGLVRRAEAEAVLQKIGPVESEFWEFPDSGLTAALTKTDLPARFRRLLSELSPTIVISPALGEVHPDHSAAAVLAELGLRSLPESRRPALLRYALHLGRRFHTEEFDLRLQLSPAEKKEKLALAGLYRSQLGSIRRILHRLADAEYFTGADDPGGPRLSPVFTGGRSSWFKTNFNARLRSVEFTAFYAGSGACARAMFRLNWGRAEAEMRDPGSGKVLGTVRFQKFFKRPGGLMVLPKTTGADLTLLCVKAGRKLDYFDAAGFVKALPPARLPEPFTCVVIPCHNIAEFCGRAVSEAARHAELVIAVDDGSTDGTARSLGEAAKAGNVRVITFPENRGKGSALLAGMRMALRETNCDLLLTMDGDLQHRPEDIPAFRRAWKEGGEFVIGYRGFSGKVPLRSRIGNNVINGFVRLFLNGALIDSQSGFRGFSRDCALAMVNSPEVREGRYETEIDIITEAVKGNWRLDQVEIPTIYIEGNKRSSFRPCADSFLITRTFLRNMTGLKKNSGK